MPTVLLLFCVVLSPRRTAGLPQKLTFMLEVTKAACPMICPLATPIATPASSPWLSGILEDTFSAGAPTTRTVAAGGAPIIGMAMLG